ncbi:MAG: SIR2 family NAD-dependent protein deacylase [Candidatus Heimdallarchaeaceae archaeon]
MIKISIEEIISSLPNLAEKSVVAITGAGISKASGMPTFRGKDGMWNQYRAEDLATPDAFKRNPVLVWDWYRARMRILLNAKPNPAHYALVKLEQSNLLLGLITQNVDGLHEIAGNSKLVEIHGRIRYARCTACNTFLRWDNEKYAQDDGTVPSCPSCSKQLRPDVVWFGEMLNQEKWQQAIQWCNNAKLMLVIGTSGVVQPVASLPHIAKRNKAKIIEFNIEPTPLSTLADYSVFGPAESTLPHFVSELVRRFTTSE